MRYTQNLAIRNATGRDNIRLFKILNSRSEHGRNMRCEVRMFSLQQTPHYTALSYCWRTEDISESIQFQGSLEGTKMISRDLMSALWAAHSHFENEWLWVDAICIDQSNTAEKNDQVPRMQTIYAGANRVLVWLGEEILHAASYHHNSGYFGLAHTYDPALGLTRGKVMQLCDDFQEGRAWWSRIWVVQEMVVARQLYVSIGTHLLGWTTFVQATGNWGWLNYEREDELLEAQRKVYALDDLRKRWWTDKDSLDLLELLDIGRHSYATDARDSIYALLGLMKKRDRERICVDYSHGADFLYAQMTAMLIERQRSLNFLVKAFTYQHPQSQSSLPSWVLDFRNCLDNYYLSDADYLARCDDNDEKEERYRAKRYQASANTRPSVRFHAQSLKLDVEAIIFDSIVASTATKRTTHIRSNNGLHEEPQEWKQSVFKVLGGFSHLKPLPSDPRSDLFQGQELPDLLDAFYYNARMVVQDDVVFTTTTGFTGFTRYDKRSREFGEGNRTENQSACPGDVIAIPLGSYKPWILRKTEVDGEYKLIGDCIIPYIMSGGVMKLVEAKQMETQWVTLV